MKGKLNYAALLVAFTLLANAVILIATTNIAYSKPALKVGDVVWAEWTPNAWYHGKIAKTCELGWFIKFDDGDEKCCTDRQVAKDAAPSPGEVKVGTAVLAQWTDGRYYPGSIAQISGNQYFIQFDDGDKRTVTINLIRLR